MGFATRRGREIDSEALVLRSKTTGENDLLCDFLTPDLGRLHGVARHGRKSHKRFGTVLESLNWVRVRGRDAGGLVSLEEAVLVRPWHRLDAHLPLLTCGFHALELVRRLVPERSPDARVFDLLVECLQALDRSPPEEARTPIARFEFRLLDASGFAPNLKECLSCRRPRGREETFAFVYREGGLFCPDCRPRSGSGASDVFTRRSAMEVLSRFVEYQLGHPLKTVKFLTDKAFCG
jgi:DNA repair protein RecO (recombination protein O)